MRAVFVNYSHPDTPHVSGMRVPRFGQTMAARGHQIVLITKSLDDDEQGIEPSALPAVLGRHDWRYPLHLPVTPVSDPWLERIRGGKLATPIRKVVVGLYYWSHYGVFSDWVAATRPYWPTLALSFKPEVAWGTFGNTDTWIVASNIAKLASSPWVGDFKDGWEDFIPMFLRSRASKRFAGAAAFTANSEHFAGQARKWFGKEARVVYSGVADCFFNRSPLEATNMGSQFRITLTGSLYEDESLIQFLRAVVMWSRKRREQTGEVCDVVYAGADSERFRRCAQFLHGDCRVTIHDYLPLEELARLCQGASLNAYLHNPTTFHHKLLELLACEKPVLVFPGESEEAIRLAREVGARLFVGRCPEDVQKVLDRTAQDEAPRTSELERFRQHFSWDAQAVNLERCLTEAQVAWQRPA